MEKRQKELCSASPEAQTAPGKRDDSFVSRQNGRKEDEESKRKKGEVGEEAEGEEEDGEGEEEEEEQSARKRRGGRFKGAEEETNDVPLQNSSNGTSISILINGVARETASRDALDLKREVPVIELSRRDAIKAVERRTAESHLVPITELRRPPPLPLPPPTQRDDARMVQLSPNAFPVPARAMLYNLAQPLAAINR